MIIRKRRTTKKWAIVGLIVLVAVIISGYVIFTRTIQQTGRVFGVDVRIAKQDPAPKKEIVYGLPARLMIPKLNIDATIRYMGVTAAGDMDTPGNITEVGWYKHGPHPGNPGSAVIAGHTIGQRGEPGIFSDLHKLVIGDTFSMVDDAGQTASFVVKQTKLFGQNDHASDVFTSSSGMHLNLITCAGEWDKDQRHYLERLVVFADKVSR